ncbi:MAG: hypothetical protein GXO64_00150 [Candidatus Micrarchaeota archaeon]|nr:hypothetical protein [Candidatus Micrarchaeota archaeon]
MVKIDSVTFGEVTIKGKVHYSDIIAWWDDKFEEIEKFHLFDSEFIKRLLKRKPEIVIVADGTEHEITISPEAEYLAEKAGVLLYHEDLKKALEIFHSFLNEGKRAVIAIHNM